MNARRYAIVAGTAAALASPAAVQAEGLSLDGAYVELRGGANFFVDGDNDPGGTGSFAGSETDYDSGFTGGIALGYAFSDRQRWGAGIWNNVRAEAEVAYSESDLDNGGGANTELTLSNYMFNLYYGCPTPHKWKPFIGGGIGAADVNFDGEALIDDDDTVFAYQLRAGLAYELSPNIETTLGYRFLDTEDPELRSAAGQRFDTETRSHAVEVGLRLRF